MVKIIPSFFFKFSFSEKKRQAVKFHHPKKALYKVGFGAGSGFSLRLVPSSNPVFGWFLVLIP
jgi:hypothetical protein